MSIAIIGGTGFSEDVKHSEPIETDYGIIPVGKLDLGQEVYFVARHYELDVPSRVNYKGNIQALALKGVKMIYAVSAGGRLAVNVLPGCLVAIDDFDWDDARIPSFADIKGILLHGAMYPPLSPYLRRNLMEAWDNIGDKVGRLYKDHPEVSLGFQQEGTYFNIEGPNFSTPAREERIRNTVKNAKIIGQTLAKEAHLARQLGIAFAGLAMCTDHSCYPGGEPVNHEKEVMGRIRFTSQAAHILLEEAVRNTDPVYHEPISHDTLRNLHPSQVNLQRLRENGRPHLVEILLKENQILLE